MSHRAFASCWGAQGRHGLVYNADLGFKSSRLTALPPFGRTLPLSEGYRVVRVTTLQFVQAVFTRLRTRRAEGLSSGTFIFFSDFDTPKGRQNSDCMALSPRRARLARVKM